MLLYCTVHFTIERERQGKAREGKASEVKARQENMDLLGSSVFLDKYKVQRGFLNCLEARSSNCIVCLSLLCIEKQHYIW